MAASLGMIENIGMIASIEAADSALKAAEVRLVDIEFVRGGITAVMITGEISAVKAGVDAAAAAVSKISGKPVVSVIPRLSDEAKLMLPFDKKTYGLSAIEESPSNMPEEATPTEMELGKMTKRALLALAEEDGIEPALLRRLRKNEIIERIKNYKHMGDE